MHRETLALQQKVLEKEHPYTLSSKESIVFLLHKQERHAKAEEIH
jgi:hypothetical protein